MKILHAFVIKKITIMHKKHGTDTIYLELDGASPFPEMEKETGKKYPPRLSIEIRKEYAEEWLEKMNMDKFENIEIINI